MGLLTKERALIENNYFQVWDIVKLLYDTQLLEREDDLDTEWSEVGLYLGHHSFDRKLQLFKKDDYYNVIPYEFYPPYQPISNLIQRLEHEWPLGDEKSIRTIKKEVNRYYWLKEDIYNFKPITDLDIIERSFLESSLEVSQHKNIALLPEPKYTTPLLEIVDAVIDRFWSSYKPDENMVFEKQIEIERWIKENYPDIATPYATRAIDRICRHPTAKSGGNKKTK